MSQPLPSSLSPILAAVNSQLSTVTGLASNLIRTVARNQTPRFQADQDILIRPGDITWDKGFDHGSGRVCLIVRRPLLIHIRSRFGVDMSDEDANKLTDPTYGLIALEESVIDALSLFIPQDVNQNWLVQEPMHPIDYPAEEEQEGQASEWIEVRLAFQLTYQVVLTQTGAGY